MMDLPNLTGALTALGALIGVAAKTNDVQLNQHLLELQQKLIGIHKDMLELQEENSTLKQQLDLQKLFVFHDSVYWKQLPDGTEDGPFCPTCHSQGVIMRLRISSYHSRYNHDSSLLIFECSTHKTDSPLGVPKHLVPNDRYSS